MDWWTRVGRTLSLAAIAAVLAALAGAGPAAAVDTVYWADQGSNSILYAPADGSAAPAVLYGSENAPDGIALDPSTGRIYWASQGSDEVRTGLLSGAAAATTLYPGQAFLDGLAVDPVGGRIYWASDNDLRGAPLAGGGVVDSVYPAENGLEGVAADVAGNLLYWTTNFGEGGDIRRGPFAGGGAATLYSPESGPLFVAVDSAAGGVWWTTTFDGVRGGDTGGTAKSTLYNERELGGITADTAAGRLFWTTSQQVRSAPIAGGGTVDVIAPATVGRGIALLRKPLNTEAPVVSPTSGRSGTVLACTDGKWSIGVPGAFLYRAPTSFAYQWQRNGSDIAGATNPTHTAESPGTYTCTVTATNQAGSTPQRSSNEAVIADPVVTLSPDAHDFGSRPLADDDPPRQTFTATNSGGATATISSLALAGPDAAAFNLESSTCGSTLGAGASCEAVVAFDPDSAGSKSASLELKTDGGDDASALSGVGVAPERPPAPAPAPKPKPKPKPRPAHLRLLVANDVVLHQPVVPTRCRTSRHTRLRRCTVKVFTLSGRLLGTGTQSAGAAKARGRRTLAVRIHVNRRGRGLVRPALGGVPVKLHAVGRVTDGRVRRDRNHTRLFAERHHLVPPISGIFVPDRPILLPGGRRFLLYIARHARRVDVVRCDGHAAKLPPFAIHPLFAEQLSVERARVACSFLRRHGMTARFVKVGHSNVISRHPDLSRLNPASWPPDRRAGVTLIRH